MRKREREVQSAISRSTAQKERADRVAFDGIKKRVRERKRPRTKTTTTLVYKTYLAGRLQAGKTRAPSLQRPIKARRRAARVSFFIFFPCDASRVLRMLGVTLQKKRLISSSEVQKSPKSPTKKWRKRLLHTRNEAGRGKGGHFSSSSSSSSYLLPSTTRRGFFVWFSR